MSYLHPGSRFQPDNTIHMCHRWKSRKRSRKARRGSLHEKGITEDASAVVVVVEGLDSRIVWTGWIDLFLLPTQLCVKSLA